MWYRFELDFMGQIPEISLKISVQSYGNMWVDVIWIRIRFYGTNPCWYHSRSLYNHMGTCGVDVIRTWIRFYETNPCWYHSRSLYNLMWTCGVDVIWIWIRFYGTNPCWYHSRSLYNHMGVVGWMWYGFELYFMEQIPAGIIPYNLMWTCGVDVIRIWIRFYGTNPCWYHSRSLYNLMGTCGVDVIQIWIKFHGTNPCWYHSRSLYNLMGTCGMDVIWTWIRFYGTNPLLVSLKISVQSYENVWGGCDVDLNKIFWDISLLVSLKIYIQS